MRKGLERDIVCFFASMSSVVSTSENGSMRGSNARLQRPSRAAPDGLPHHGVRRLGRLRVSAAGMRARCNLSRLPGRVFKRAGLAQGLCSSVLGTTTNALPNVWQIPEAALLARSLRFAAFDTAALECSQHVAPNSPSTVQLAYSRMLRSHNFPYAPAGLSCARWRADRWPSASTRRPSASTRQTTRPRSCRRRRPSSLAL